MVCENAFSLQMISMDLVLILVLMEYGLRGLYQKPKVIINKVLILVLMEYGLRERYNQPTQMAMELS